MRWLVVSPYLPHSAIGHGGGTCVFDLCRNLARDHDTRLLCFQRSEESGLERELEESGVEVVTVSFRSAQDRGIARLVLAADRLRCAAQSRATRRPFMSVKYARSAMRRALVEAIREFQPDIVQVEYGFMGPYAEIARQSLSGSNRAPGNRELPRPIVLLNTHELVSLARLRQLAAETKWWRLARRRHAVEGAARLESQFPLWADQVLCVTDQDRVLLQAMTGASNLCTVPLGSDVDRLPLSRRQNSDPPTLLFVGSFGHPPNVDGAVHLVRDILPRLWQSRPELRLDIVGADPPEQIRALVANDPRIQLLGFVDSLDDCFDRASIFVAPLRAGGGIKIKILEAMARGAAVVTSPIGAEGIDEDGTACVIARDPEEHAQAILDLLADEDARSQLRIRARHHIEQSYGWSSIIQRLSRCAEEAAASPTIARD